MYLNKSKLELKDYIIFRRLDVMNKFVHNNNNDYYDFVDHLTGNYDYLMQRIEDNRNMIEQFCKYNTIQLGGNIGYT